MSSPVRLHPLAPMVSKLEQLHVLDDADRQAALDLAEVGDFNAAYLHIPAK